MQTQASGSVLGITDFGPVGGAPLIPPFYLTAYFISFLVLLTILYVYFHHKKKPVLLWHKLRLLAVIVLALKTTVILGGGLLAAYWLVPAPGVSETVPKAQTTSFGTSNRVEIIFDRPLSRKDLIKTITPDVPGRWVFEESLYSTHLYRKLVFYPTFSFRPGTTYAIKLSGIQNLIEISKPYEYVFDFTTQQPPKVQKVTPGNSETGVPVNSEIKVTLDAPNENVSEYNFVFDPQIPFDVKLDALKTLYTLKPRESMKQGTAYKLTISKSDVILNLEDGSISERGSASNEYEGVFTTVEAPGVKSFIPNRNDTPVDSEIKIEFSKKMDKLSVQNHFSIQPTVLLNFTWSDESTLSVKPARLNFDTDYSVKISAGAKSLDGGVMETDVIKTFKTIGPVRVARFDPANGLGAINVNSPIKVTFDQEVDHASAESLFSITPKVEGSFQWAGNTLSFVPKTALPFNTNYNVAVAQGVRSIKGQPSKESFQTSFTTQNANVKLSVPVYLQKYTLSCEIASLRMALNFRGAGVTEDDIIPLVGLDPTPHNGNVWGNPYNAFVGNIAGTQMKDGYGVYWGPIARAARNWRGAQEFENWSIGQLTNEISKGNPVVIWVYSSYGTPTSWFTPDGTKIYAVRDEHAVTAVGFVGTSDNPAQIIINDPLHGQVYWSRASFDRKWKIFNNSGVVVY